MSSQFSVVTTILHNIWIQPITGQWFFLASSEWFHLTRNINVLPVNELFSTGSSYFFNFSTHSFGILISIFVLPLFSLSLILKAPCLCVSFNWLNLLRTYHATHFNLKVARDFVILLFCWFSRTISDERLCYVNSN